MTPKKSLLSDGAWVAGLQGLAAVGQLAGIRLLTEVVPPAIFGQFSLLIGMVALVAGGLANPTMQALLRYYPEYALKRNGGLVRAVARQQVFKLFAWMLPVFAVGAVAARLFGGVSGIDLILLFALIVVEMARMQDSALLNAAREHRIYGLWAVAEAWGRPTLAWLLVTLMGVSTTKVLVGVLLASSGTLLVIRRFVPHYKSPDDAGDQIPVLVKKFWQYSLPLLPLGVIGWVSGMADRYMIGVFMSSAEVGLYVAIYGLASRPMLMLGRIVETAIRPVYMSALVEGDVGRAHSYLNKWALLIAAGSLSAIVLALLGHHWIVSLLLAEQYRSVSYLLPWIVGGYVFYLAYQVVGRVCYAHGATFHVLVIEGFGGLLAIVVGIVCIKYAGLWGAAFAVCIYYGMQFMSALFVSRRWLLDNSVEMLARNSK